MACGRCFDSSTDPTAALRCTFRVRRLVRLIDPAGEAVTDEEVSAFLAAEGDWALDVARFTVLKHQQGGAPGRRGRHRPRP